MNKSYRGVRQSLWLTRQKIGEKVFDLRSRKVSAEDDRLMAQEFARINQEVRDEAGGN